MNWMMEHSDHDPEEDDVDVVSCQEHQHSSCSSSYVSRKPLWWRRQAGKKPSKARRRLLNDPSLQSLYLLQRPQRHGDFLEWEQIFPSAAVAVDDIDSPVITNTNSQAPRPKIWLEIGFGLGDNLLRLVEQYSNSNSKYYFVGSEVHAGGTAAVLHRIVQQQQQTQESSFWTGYTLWKPEDDHPGFAPPLASSGTPSALIPSHQSPHNNNNNNPYRNLRLHTGDGVKLLACLPSHSLEAVLVTFPDPFFDSNYNEKEQERDPLDHHHHHTECRLLQLDVLAQIWRVLVLVAPSSGGDANDDAVAGRLYLATDHAGYHAWSHQQVERFNRHHESSILRVPSSGGDGTTTTTSNSNNSTSTSTNHNETTCIGAHFRCLNPTPDRRQWLPVVSKYEQKGRDEGRSTYLSCWEATACKVNTVRQSTMN